MPLSWTLFSNDVSPTGPNLDADLSLAMSAAFLPCTVSGTNSLTLGAMITGFVVAAYQNYMGFCGVAVNANSGPVQATYQGLGLLNCYKDTASGPAAFTGGEIQPGNLIFFNYDSALNSGAGGFHLDIGPAGLIGLYLPITGGVLTGDLGLPGLNVPAASGSTVSSILSGSASIAFVSLVPGGHSDQLLTISGVSIGDVIALGYPTSIVPGTSFDGFVSAASIVTIRAFNFTPASTLTPLGGVYRATAIRSVP